MREEGEEGENECVGGDLQCDTNETSSSQSQSHRYSYEYYSTFEGLSTDEVFAVDFSVIKEKYNEAGA